MGGKNMKKNIVLIIVLLMLLSLAACGDVNGQSDISGDTSIGGLFWDILHGERGDSDSQKNQSITVSIFNETDIGLSDIAISWSQNGTVLGSRGMEHTNKTIIAKDEKCSFEFLPEDFKSGEMTDLQFDVFAGVIPGEDYVACGSIFITDPVFGEEYVFEIRFEEEDYSLWQVFDNGTYARMSK